MPSTLLQCGSYGVLMVGFESFNRVLEDDAYGQSFGSHGFFEYRLVIVSYGAHKADRPVSLVLHQVAANELHEVVVDKCVNARVVDVIGTELG